MFFLSFIILVIYVLGNGLGSFVVINNRVYNIEKVKWL